MTDIFEQRGFEQRVEARFHALALPAAPDRLWQELHALPASQSRSRSARRWPTLALAAALGALLLVGAALVVGGAIRDAFRPAPPDRGLFTPTPGWLELWDIGGDALASPDGGGVAVTLPKDATLLAVTVMCEGDGTAIASVGDATGTTVACGSPAVTGRSEFAVTGGEQVDVKVVVDDAQLIRLHVEANAFRTYPSAPPLPAGIAATPYSVGGGDQVAVGTLGDNTETIIEAAGTPGTASGGLVPIAVRGARDEADRLDLYSVADGAFVRTLAAVAAPAFIYDSWVDGTHQHVFYAVHEGLGGGATFHRVGVDGTDDRIVATVPTPNGNRQANLALDDSVFVVESCGHSARCERIVVDTATLESRTHAGSTGDVCELIGVADGVVVERAGPSCGPTTPVPSGDPAAPAPLTVRAFASSLDGSGERALTDGDRLGRLVRTRDGLRLVTITQPTDAGPAPVAGASETAVIEIIDVATGDKRVLASTPEEDLGMSVWLQDVRLPPDWVLFASFLGDLPGVQNSWRPAPLLVNVLTGERIELPNLPHTLS